MKLFKNLVEAIFVAERDIFIQHQQADHYIQHLFLKQKKWGARDRHWVADVVYDLVRYYRFYCFLINKEKITTDEDAVALFSAYLLTKNVPIPEWETFANVDTTSISTNLQKEIPIAIKESFPEWLHSKGEAQFGKDWASIMHNLNQPAALCIRVNNTLTTAHKIQQQFEKLQISLTQIGDFSFVVNERKNLQALDGFKNGLFEIQDCHSQLIVPFLDLDENKMVIDACAGAGGKTLQIASLLQAKGKVIAHDSNAHKLEILKERGKRNKLNNIEVEKNLENLLQRYNGKADAVLVDAPCSGLGVLKRNPDSKWKMTPEKINEIKFLQQKVLQDYAALVKNNSLLVYATCTIFRDENNDQIETFLQTNRSFVLEEEKLILPSLEGFDGFYVAKMRKK